MTKTAHLAGSVLIILLSSLSLSAGSNNVTEKAKEELVIKGFCYLYNFQFKKADSLIAAVQLKYPSDIFVLMLSANRYWWRIISGEDTKSNRSLFLSQLTEAENTLSIQNKQKKSDEELFFLINIYAYRSRVELLSDNYFRTISHLDKSIDYVQKSFDRIDYYDPFLLTTGLYNYFMAKAKKDYILLYPVLSIFPSANEIKGIEMLVKCIKLPDEQIQTEALYFLMRINLESENKPGLAESFGKILIAKYPNNLIYRYYYLKTLIKKGDVKLVEQQLKTIYACCKNNELNEEQRNHFQLLAQKDMEIFNNTK